MTDQLITFETAKLAKDKGFPQNIAYDHYLEDGKTMTNDYYKHRLFVEKDKLTAAPTQSLLQKWLRETHNLDVGCMPLATTVDGNLKKSYTSRVDNWNVIWSVHDGTSLTMPEHYHFEKDTYEESLELGLQKALKLI